MELLQLVLFILSFYIYDGQYATTFITIFLFCKILFNIKLHVSRDISNNDPFIAVLNIIHIILNMSYLAINTYINKMKSDPVYRFIFDSYDYINMQYLKLRNRIFSIFYKQPINNNKTILKDDKDIQDFLNDL